jgi:putative oxidoreductase
MMLAAVYDLDGLNLGLFVLRVLGGVTLALHGIQKFRGGLEGVGRWFDSEGLHPGRTHALVAASSETGGGLLLAAGLLTPLASMAVIGTMTVAGYVGHRKNGFFSVRNGWEYTFILATIAASLAATGPGEWSVDNAAGIEWNGVVWFVVAVVGGLATAVGFLAAFYRPQQPATAPSAS